MLPDRLTARTMRWLLGLALGSGSVGTAAAQVATAPAPGAVDGAIRQAIASDRVLLVVLTAEALPSSRQFAQELLGSALIQSLGDAVVVHELIAEREPERARQLAATAVPAVYAYRQGPRGFARIGSLPAPRSVAEVGQWLGTLANPAASPGASPTAPVAVRDEGLTRTNHTHSQGAYAAQATPQAVGPPSVGAPPQPTPPYPQQPPAQPPAAPPVMAPPTVGAPPQQPLVGLGVPQPTVVVPAPSPSIYVQQQPPTVVVGSPSTANVVYASSVASPALGAPMLAAAPTMAAAPAMAMAPTVGVPAAPALGAAPVSPTIAMVPAVGAAPAAQPATQQVVGLVLDRPGPLKRMLAALGRELANLGNPRIRMATNPEFATVALPTTPVVSAPPAQQAPPIVVPQAPPETPDLSQVPPRPSPQQQPGGKKGLFHHN